MKYQAIRKLHYKREKKALSKHPLYFDMHNWLKSPYTCFKIRLYIELSSIIVYFLQNTKAKSQSRIQELQAEYQLKEQFEAQNHKRRMAEIQLNNTGKVQVATKSGDVKLKSQDKQAYNQSRMIEQKRDRALPLSQLEQKESNPLEDIGTPENPLPENLK